MKIILIFLLLAHIVAAQENITENAINAISRAETTVGELNEFGFGIQYFNDTLNDAKDAFKKSNYDMVFQKIQDIEDRKVKAYSISDSLRVLNQRIEDLAARGLQVDEQRNIFNAAQKIFENELYDDVEKLIPQIEKKLDGIEAESTTILATFAAAKDNVIIYVRENWHFILLSIVVLSASVFLVYRRIKIIKIRNKLKDIVLEKKVLENLIRESQTQYMQGGSISKEEYDLTAKMYRDRILKIRREMPVLENALKGKIKERKAEEKRLGKMIGKLKKLKPKITKLIDNIKKLDKFIENIRKIKPEIKLKLKKKYVEEKKEEKIKVAIILRKLMDKIKKASLKSKIRAKEVKEKVKKLGKVKKPRFSRLLQIMRKKKVKPQIKLEKRKAGKNIREIKLRLEKLLKRMSRKKVKPKLKLEKRRKKKYSGLREKLKNLYFTSKRK